MIKSKLIGPLALMTLLLAACGGGSDSTGSQAAARAGRAPLDNLNNPPSIQTFAQAEAETLEKTNTLRRQLGLNPLALQRQLTEAAINHTAYQLETREFGHFQTQRSARNYLAEEPVQRVKAVGYSGSRLLELTAAVSPFKSAGFLHDLLVDAPYHRVGMFRDDLTEIGIAYGVEGRQAVLTMQYGRPAAVITVPGNNRGVVQWPQPGRGDVPTQFASDSESPDPVPDRNIVGYPISFQVSPDVILAVQAFTLQEQTASGFFEVTNTRLLLSSNDLNMEPFAAVLIPLDRLKADTVYQATFRGRIGGQLVEYRWQFKTA